MSVYYVTLSWDASGADVRSSCVAVVLACIVVTFAGCFVAICHVFCDA